MIERAHFDAIRNRWGAHSSWAVWRESESVNRPKEFVDDLSLLDPDTHPETLGILNPSIVFIGLNGSSRPGNGASAWGNFHDPSSRNNDFKIRYALSKTSYWGAYMTDVLVDFHETDSHKVSQVVRSTPELLEEQLDRLLSELKDLKKDNPLLIAFGNDVFNTLSRESRFNTYRIVKIPHFANYVGKEKYREQVRVAIAGGLKELAA